MDEAEKARRRKVFADAKLSASDEREIETATTGLRMRVTTLARQNMIDGMDPGEAMSSAVTVILQAVITVSYIDARRAERLEAMCRTWEEHANRLVEDLADARGDLQATKTHALSDDETRRMLDIYKRMLADKSEAWAEIATAHNSAIDTLVVERDAARADLRALQTMLRERPSS